MSLLCRLFGHRVSPQISGETGDLRSHCLRCGANLVMYGFKDWRSVDVGKRRFSLRALIGASRQRAACRLGRHSAVPNFAQWVNTPSGLGYHAGRCRACDAQLRRYPGEDWRPATDEDQD